MQTLHSIAKQIQRRAAAEPIERKPGREGLIAKHGVAGTQQQIGSSQSVHRGRQRLSERLAGIRRARCTLEFGGSFRDALGSAGLFLQAPCAQGLGVDACRQSLGGEVPGVFAGNQQRHDGGLSRRTGGESALTGSTGSDSKRVRQASAGTNRRDISSRRK